MKKSKSGLPGLRQDKPAIKTGILNTQTQDIIFQSIIDQIEDSVFSVDRNYCYTSFNLNHCLSMKSLYDVEIRLGGNVLEYITVKMEREKSKSVLDYVFLTGHQSKHVRFAGSKKFNRKSLEIMVRPIFDQNNAICGALVLSKDITQKKMMEKQKRESEDKFRLLFMNSPDASFVSTAKDGIICEANQNMLDLFGYSREEMIGHPSSELKLWVNYEDRLKLMQELNEHGFACKESTGRRKNGEIFNGVIAESLINLNNISYLIGTVRDISQFIDTKTRLEESKMMHSSIINSTEDMIWAVDPVNFNIIQYNESFKDYFLKQWKLKVRIGMPPGELFPTSEITELWIGFYKKALQKGSFKTEYKTLAQDRVLSVNLNPLILEGKCIGISIFGEDITEQKKAQDKLEKLLDLEGLLTDIALKFVSVDYDEINHAIADAQGVICEALGFDLSVMYIPSNDTELSLQLSHLYFKDKSSSQLENHFSEFRKNFPWCEKQLSSGQFVIVNSIKELPDEAFIDIDSWKRCGIQSSLMLPLLIAENTLIGTISFEMISHERLLTESLVKRLKLVAQLFASVLERKYHEEKLTESESKFRNVTENALTGIYIVQDGYFSYTNSSFEKIFGYQPGELIGVNPLSIVYRDDRQKVFHNMRKRITKEQESMHYEFRGKRKNGAINYIDVLGSVIYLHDKPAIIGNIIDITKRKHAEMKLEESYQKIKKTLKDAIITMSKIVEIRDPYTAGHQQRVAKLSVAIGRQMGLSEAMLENLYMAAIIHDIGKIYVPFDILNKPGKLNDVEFSLIKMHARSGFDIVKNMDFPPVIARIILQHHEKINGEGYPEGLKGAQIELKARILTVADVLEAIASHRPYRPALGIQAALEELNFNKGKLYDTDAVNACVAVIRKGFMFDEADSGTQRALAS